MRRRRRRTFSCGRYPCQGNSCDTSPASQTIQNLRRSHLDSRARWEGPGSWQSLACVYCREVLLALHQACQKSRRRTSRAKRPGRKQTKRRKLARRRKSNELMVNSKQEFKFYFSFFVACISNPEEGHAIEAAQRQFAGYVYMRSYPRGRAAYQWRPPAIFRILVGGGTLLQEMEG